MMDGKGLFAILMERLGVRMRRENWLSSRWLPSILGMYVRRENIQAGINLLLENL